MVYCNPAGSIYWSARTTLWGDRKPRDTGGSLFQRGVTEMAIGRSANLSDEVKEGRSSVRAEEERVERERWMYVCTRT